MRVIGHRPISHRAVTTAVLAILTVAPMRADRANDILAAINYVASALTANNASDAMTPFDKSFSDYAKLLAYFSGLTNGSQLANEIDVVDEQDESATRPSLTIQWTLTMTNKTSFETQRRSGEIHVRLALQDGKWRIVDFSPIDLFNPQSKWQPR
jgi:hypothetical protein